MSAGVSIGADATGQSHALPRRVRAEPSGAKTSDAARRGRRKAETSDQPAPARHVSMTWAQWLKGVFKIDILTCADCGGALKV